eukprot:2262498-Rhodomonas_salina.1
MGFQAEEALRDLQSQGDGGVPRPFVSSVNWPVGGESVDVGAPCRFFGRDKSVFINPTTGEIHEFCSFRHAAAWEKALVKGTIPGNDC